MAKKSKTRRVQLVATDPEQALTRKDAAKAARAGAGKKAEPGKKSVAGKSGIRKSAPAAAKAGKKRAAAALALHVPMARARKLAGDLYQSASLALWASAIETAPEPVRSELIQLQDAICDAADLFKEAKAANPKHLGLYLVACFDREDLPVTAPRFVTAASAEEALNIWRTAFKGEYGRRKPRALPVPALSEAPRLHEQAG